MFLLFICVLIFVFYFRDLYGWEDVRLIVIENFKKYRGEMYNIIVIMLVKDFKFI